MGQMCACRIRPSSTRYILQQPHLGNVVTVRVTEARFLPPGSDTNAAVGATVLIWRQAPLGRANCCSNQSLDQALLVLDTRVYAELRLAQPCVPILMFSLTTVQAPRIVDEFCGSFKLANSPAQREPLMSNLPSLTCSEQQCCHIMPDRVCTFRHVRVRVTLLPVSTNLFCCNARQRNQSKST